MTLNKLNAPKGSSKVRKRVGRGQASGQGKTAGRGAKGQKARSGNMRFEGFEGGQMPLQRRLPKFGFTNFNRREFAEVKAGDLEGLQGVVDPAAMKAAGLIGKAADAVVVLAGGELTGAVSVKAHRVTAGARAAIEKAGGKIEIIPAPVTKQQVEKVAKRAASANKKKA
jgi:large subunit ribosomal protein L15